jgi:hypothetical protein
MLKQNNRQLVIVRAVKGIKETVGVSVILLLGKDEKAQPPKSKKGTTKKGCSYLQEPMECEFTKNDKRLQITSVYLICE